jgi:L-iditol 2-dehydrogenase
MFSAESTNIIPILDPMMVANYPDLYDPEIVTKSAEFRVISPNETVTKEVNIGCAYNPAHEIHLVQLPIPNPREGEVVVHIKSTGICGSDCHFW